MFGKYRAVDTSQRLVNFNNWQDIVHISDRANR